MKVYDCFLFYNELDILDIRFNYLDEIVDKFVLVESNVTFSGIKKELFYEKNKHLFEKYHNKIIHIVVDDTPDDFYNIPFIKNYKTEEEKLKNLIFKHLYESKGWPRSEKQWGREIYHRESIKRGLSNCENEDLIMISDVDEIPNREEILFLKNNYENFEDNIIELKQKMFYYYINILKENNWSGTKISNYKKIKNLSLNEIRSNKHTNKVIQNGGWHISFIGGVDRVKSKIEAYAHQEFNNDYIKSNILNNIESGKDIFFRNIDSFKIVNLSEEYPEDLLKIINQKYSYMIKGSKIQYESRY